MAELMSSRFLEKHLIGYRRKGECWQASQTLPHETTTHIVLCTFGTPILSTVVTELENIVSASTESQQVWPGIGYTVSPSPPPPSLPPSTDPSLPLTGSATALLWHDPLPDSTVHIWKQEVSKCNYIPQLSPKYCPSECKSRRLSKFDPSCLL